MGFFGADTAGIQGSPISETLPHNVRANLEKSRNTFRGLTKAPSTAQANTLLKMDEAQAAQAALRGSGPAQEASYRDRGVGLGAQIVGQGGMAIGEEAVGREARALKAEYIQAQLAKGQIAQALIQRTKNYAARIGASEAQQMAMVNAASTLMAGGVEAYKGYKKQKNTSGQTLDIKEGFE